MTVNSGRLGPTAVDLVALAAERFWPSDGSNLKDRVFRISLVRGRGKETDDGNQLGDARAIVSMGLALLASFVSIRFNLRRRPGRDFGGNRRGQPGHAPGSASRLRTAWKP